MSTTTSSEKMQKVVGWHGFCFCGVRVEYKETEFQGKKSGAFFFEGTNTKHFDYAFKTGKNTCKTLNVEAPLPQKAESAQQESVKQEDPFTAYTRPNDIMELSEQIVESALLLADQKVTQENPNLAKTDNVYGMIRNARTDKILAVYNTDRLLLVMRGQIKAIEALTEMVKTLQRP